MSTSPEASTAKDPFARLKGELNQLEATARDRLKGSKLGELVERAPTLVQKELDALLDRAGLVRKAALENGAVVAAPVEVPAAEVVEARADVDVSAEVVAEVATEVGDVATVVTDVGDVAGAKKKKR